MVKSKQKPDLASSLLASFEALGDTVPAPAPQAETPPPVTDKPTPRVKAKRPAKPKALVAKRSTITYHDSDDANADAILDALKKQAGVRATFSEAVRIALALCPKDPKLIEQTWAEKRAEDGRVTRHRE